MVVAPAWAAADEANVEIAKQRFALGDLLYRSERYREAVVEFEAAHKLAPGRPDFDYNIGRCYDKLRDWDRAISAYTRYVESTPTPLDAEQILQHIEELKQAKVKMPTERSLLGSSVLTSADDAQPGKRPGRALRITGITLGAIGIVGLGVGAGFGVASNGTADQLTSLGRSMARFDPNLDSELSTQRALEGAFLGIGAAALAAGAVTFTLGMLAERRWRRAHYAAAPSLQVEF
jgi:tetratricopeptide (TPR) repeat protein